jgi:regulator of sigma E protease
MAWILTLIGICALVILHELGHFIAAKALGMRVERFSLFFPPTIARVRRGETEYAIGAIPAGGYVKITGMSPQEIDELEPDVRKRAYYCKPPWKRIVVILAGPGVNLLIAFLLFWGVLFAGSVNGAATLQELNPSVKTVRESTAVGTVERNMPASGALQRGDRIVAVDGKPARSLLAITTDVNAHRCAGGATAEGCHAATPVRLTVERDKRLVTLTLVPRYNAPLKRMLIGFSFARPTARAYGIGGAAVASLQEMWGITESTVTNVGRAFTEPKVRHQFRSIVGLTEVAHESIQAGAGYALVILGFISLALAVINLFPFLPLDGGHVAWSLAEWVRGKRVSLNAMWRYSTVGIVLLAFLVINGLSNDISRIAG